MEGSDCHECDVDQDAVDLAGLAIGFGPGVVRANLLSGREWHDPHGWIVAAERGFALIRGLWGPNRLAMLLLRQQGLHTVMTSASVADVSRRLQEWGDQMARLRPLRSRTEAWQQGIEAQCWGSTLYSLREMYMH